jgi:hypothetical protein
MKKVLVVLLGLSSLTLAACGSRGSSLPTTPSVPAQPSTPVAPFTQQVSGTVKADEDTVFAFTAPRDGTMTLTLTWADGSQDLDLSLTAAQCTDWLPSTCPLYAITDGATGMTEKIVRSVTAGEAFRIWVVSVLGTLDQAYTIDIDVR